MVQRCSEQMSAGEDERCPDADTDADADGLGGASAGQSSSPTSAGATVQQHQAPVAADAGTSPERVAVLAEKKRKACYYLQLALRSIGHEYR